MFCYFLCGGPFVQCESFVDICRAVLFGQVWTGALFHPWRPPWNGQGIGAATPAGFIALGEVIGAGVATNHGPQPQGVPLPARKDLYPQTTSHRTAEPTGGGKDLRGAPGGEDGFFRCHKMR